MLCFFHAHKLNEHVQAAEERFEENSVWLAHIYSVFLCVCELSMYSLQFHTNIHSYTHAWHCKQSTYDIRYAMIDVWQLVCAILLNARYRSCFLSEFWLTCIQTSGGMFYGKVCVVLILVRRIVNWVFSDYECKGSWYMSMLFGSRTKLSFESQMIFKVQRFFQR